MLVASTVLSQACSSKLVTDELKVVMSGLIWTCRRYMLQSQLCGDP